MVKQLIERIRKIIRISSTSALTIQDDAGFDRFTFDSIDRKFKIDDIEQSKVLVEENLGTFTANQTKTTSYSIPTYTGAVLIKLYATGIYHTNAIYSGVYFDSVDFGVGMKLVDTGYLGTTSELSIRGDGKIDITIKNNPINEEVKVRIIKL